MANLSQRLKAVDLDGRAARHNLLAACKTLASDPLALASRLRSSDHVLVFHEDSQGQNAGTDSTLFTKSRVYIGGCERCQNLPKRTRK